MRSPVALAALILVGCAGSVAAPAPTPAHRSPPINADELRRDLTVFASDSFTGRETGSVGEQKAATFLAERLGALGVEPAGDSGSYFQRFPLERRTYTTASRIEVRTPRGTTAIPMGESLVPLPTLGPGAPLPRLSAEGDIVFAGHATNLAGLDLRNKVVVFINGAPAGTDSARRGQLESQQALGMRIGQILAHGPVAVIALLQGKFASDFALAAPELLSSTTAPSGAAPVPDSARTFPMVLLGLPREGSPLLPTGWPRDDRPQALTGHRLVARLVQQSSRIEGTNVVGIVRGSDPAMRSTYVALGAHLDHIGIAHGAPDSVNNGADDDGSGSVMLLALARRFQGDVPHPRRSILFVWHGGEEKGLLGSAHFTSHPTVPIDSVVAQLNADMIGRNGPDSLYVVGPSAAPGGQSRVLGAVLDSVNGAMARPFTFNREWDSPTHPEQIYFRSDHYSYAQKGIPIVFVTSGLHPQYHKPGDEVGLIDFDKLAHVGNLMYDLTRALGDRATRPR